MQKVGSIRVIALRDGVAPTADSNCLRHVKVASCAPTIRLGGPNSSFVDRRDMDRSRISFRRLDPSGAVAQEMPPNWGQIGWVL